MLKVTAVQQFKSTFVSNVRTPTKKKLSTILRENAIRQEIIDKKNVIPKFIPEVDPETENNLTLTDPIPPAYSVLIKQSKDILYEEALDDHPLWQFFPAKKLVRSRGLLDTSSRPWTVSELRIKSFNDLHYIYISCLKEINTLNRELAYLDPQRGLEDIYIDTESHRKLRTKLSVTMNNIKAVIKDRKFAHDMSKFELIDRHIFKDLNYDYKEFQLLKANKELYQEKAEKYIEMEKNRLLNLKKENLQEGEDIEDYEKKLNKAFAINN
ncbi:mitochondrial 54S ribosomal protein YmL4 [Hanseniaspora uvarum]|nr:mitochondrial 54S ribosomal protein YmL4 [Hanseniaspora uvarum]